MQKSEIKIFFSWQSDLPNNVARSLIQESISEVVKYLRDTVAIDADRDTKGEMGSPDIVQTIFTKIDECDIFVADVSAICSYQPVDKEGASKGVTKLVPNPNVLIELGYAAHVIGWENIICIANTDYGALQHMPFDIAHRRIYTYSLKAGDKGTIKKEIGSIIQKTVISILENGKRVNSRFSNIKIGSFELATNEFHKQLIPFNLREAPTFLSEQQSAINECKDLISAITQTYIAPAACSDETVITQTAQPFKLDIFKTSSMEISDSRKDRISSQAKQYLNCDIDMNSDFFFLGDLKKKNVFSLEPSYELEGTEKEKEKYEEIVDLELLLHLIWFGDWYLHTFNGLLFFPLAVKNESTIADEEITISLRVNTEKAEVVLPSKNLINPDMKGLEGNIYEEGIIETLLKMPESVKISYDPAAIVEYEHIYPAYTPLGPIGGVNGTPKYDSDDYVEELEKYIACPLDESMSEFSFTIKSLHAKEIKWLGAALLIKPTSDSIEISYSIKSKNSDGSLAGTLVCNKV